MIKSTAMSRNIVSRVGDPEGEFSRQVTFSCVTQNQRRAIGSLPHQGLHANSAYQKYFAKQPDYIQEPLEYQIADNTHENVQNPQTGQLSEKNIISRGRQEIQQKPLQLKAGETHAAIYQRDDPIIRKTTSSRILQNQKIAPTISPRNVVGKIKKQLISDSDKTAKKIIVAYDQEEHSQDIPSPKEKIGKSKNSRQLNSNKSDFRRINHDLGETLRKTFTILQENSTS